MDDTDKNKDNTQNSHIYDDACPHREKNHLNYHQYEVKYRLEGLKNDYIGSPVDLKASKVARLQDKGATLVDKVSQHHAVVVEASIR